MPAITDDGYSDHITGRPVAVDSRWGRWARNIALMSTWRRTTSVLLLFLGGATRILAGARSDPISPTNIFSPDSTPAYSIFRLSIFTLEIQCAIFAVVFSLLVYAVLKFRHHKKDDTEPPQIYGSNQMELAWTVLPVLIVVVLFLSTAQVIHRVQDAQPPARTRSK